MMIVTKEHHLCGRGATIEIKIDLPLTNYLDEYLDGGGD